MNKIFILIVSGSLGTLARYALSGFVYGQSRVNFPYGTLVVNLLGCLIVGFLAAISEKKFMLNSDMRLFFIIGFCGAFTTFSALIFESDYLLRDGQMMPALTYIFSSIIFGFLLFRAGTFLGNLI